MFRFPSKTNALAFIREIGMTFGTILDVGTHAETPELREAFPTESHLLFEPAAEFYSRIASNYAGLKWELVPVAVSDSDGTGRLRKVAITGGEISHATLSAGGTSNEAADEEVGGALGTIDIPTIRLDTFLKDRSDLRPFLLKIDVDGFEVPILRGAEGIWNDVDCIILEATADTFQERLQFVLTRNFRLIDIVDQCYYSGVFSQADLIFVSERVYQENPRLRPWQTQEFAWEKWVPIANLEARARPDKAEQT